MILQVRVLAEPPVADVALEGPGTIVDIHVRLEISRSRERFRAERALVRLLLEKKEKKNERVTRGGTGSGRYQFKRASAVNSDMQCRH